MGKSWSSVAAILVFSLISLSLASTFGLGTPSASPSPGSAFAVGSKPEMHVQGSADSSLNWGGYAVTGPSGSVTEADGSWIVPSVVCSSSTTYVAVWVGIDGFNSNSVEQTGILGECNHGTPTYYAWYEFYPNPMYQITSVAVAPGDTIAAHVTYTGSSDFMVSVTSSGGGAYSTTQSVSGAAMTSAEWVVERPSLCNIFGCTLSTLANFGLSYFGLQYTKVSGTGFATVSGITGSIGSFSTSTPITMVDTNGNTLAQPSALSDSGTSFYMTYGGGVTTTTSTTITTSSSITTSSKTTSSVTSTTTTTSSSSTTTQSRHHH